MEELNLKIMSLEECIELITIPTDSNLVSIRSSNIGINIYDVIDNAKDNYNSIISVTFDDVERDEPGYITPDEKQIRDILDWAKDKNNIVVHCTAGISRSSAIAYLIACTKMPKEQAIKYLNFTLHCSNHYVVNLGALVLNNINVYRYCIEKENEFLEKRI